MRFSEIVEAHYNLGGNEELVAPLESTDTITVYHNFRDVVHVLDVIKYGLSGRSRVPRVYSYESDNNPYGLFVSPDFRTVDDFGSVIIEFNARVSDLEPPVWPGGGYTVQGGYSQYWGHGRSGVRARRRAQRDLRKRYSSDESDVIARSVDPLLAVTLTGMGERQALFVGHLDPSDITRIFERVGNRSHSWEEVSVHEFLDRHAAEVSEYEKHRHEHSSKIFKPSEEFNGEVFIERLSGQYGKDISNTLKSIWNNQILSQGANRTVVFVDIMGSFLWPRQFPGAYRWFGKTFGTGVTRSD